MLLKAYSKFLDGLEHIFNIIMGLLLAAMTGIIFYQVILRYIFQSPNIWAEEVVKFMFAWSCFVGAPICMRHNSHLKVDFLIQKMPEKFRYLWQSVILFASIIFAAILVPISLPMVKQVINQLSMGAQIPMWIPYLTVPFGGVFIVVFGIEAFLKNVEKHIEVTQLSKQKAGVV